MDADDLLLNNLTPAAIHQIAWEIRDGTADPEDARRLLYRFCDLYDRQEATPYELLRHLRESFRSYLDGNQTLESALGLKRRKARPKADPKIRTQMATEVLRLRLSKTSHQDAVHEVAERFGWGITVIGDAWKAHKQDALICLRFERALDAYPWTPEEIKRLNQILGKESWFIDPEKSDT